MHNKALLAVFGSFMALTSPPRSMAQEIETQAEGGRLEEITVTARKREESAQDVPLALTAISGDTLTDRHIVSVTELPQLAPNLSIHEAFASPSVAVIYLRGFGTSTNDPSVQPPVSINIDNVYQASLAGSVVDTFDLERVEVLRGPQNTLIGKNSPAGAINFYTKRPTGEWGGDVQVDYGRFERREARARLNFPIIDEVLAGRLSAYFDDGGSYIDNVSIPGREHGGKKGHTIRGGLLLTPSENIEWYLSSALVKRRDEIFGYRNVSTDVAYPPLVSPSISCMVVGLCNAFPKRFTTGAGVEGQPKVDTNSVTSNFTWDVGAFNLTSNTGYKYLNQSGVEDVDATILPLFDAPKVQTIARDFSQEVRLNSTENGFLTFAGKFDWLLGVYYIRQKYEGHRIFTVPGPTELRDFQDGKIESLAGFAHVIYNFTQDWNATFGIRRTKDDWTTRSFPRAFPRAR
ncbi:MAG: TonB-dependent receptor plug domain-containing protein [Steroidobacteraceae bacterium]